MPKYSKLPFKTKIQKHENRNRTSFPKPLNGIDNMIFSVKREGNELIWDIDISSLVNHEEYFKVYKKNDFGISYEISIEILDILNINHNRYKDTLKSALEERSSRELDLKDTLRQTDYTFSWNTKFDGHIIETEYQINDHNTVGSATFHDFGFQTKNIYINFLGYLRGRRNSKISINELENRFNLNTSDILYILDKLQKHNIIQAKIKGKQLEISSIIINDDTKKIWVKDELIVIGYFKLKNIVSITEISKVLNIDKNRVENILFSNLYAKEIDATLQIKGNDLYFKFIQLPKINLYYQIIYCSIPPKLWQETIEIDYAANESITGISDNPTLLQLIKTVAGILILRREMKLSSLINQVIIDSSLIQNISEKKVLWQVLSILSISNLIDITFHENTFYSQNNISKFSVGKLIPILGYEKFNYSALLGYLSSNRTSKLKNIAKMISSEFKWSNTEILQILGNLAVDGVIQAILSSDDVLTCSVVRFFENTSSGLNFEERILLGTIISQKRPTIPRIASILNKSKSEIENIYYSFKAKENALGEISRSGEIIIHKLPEIPPLAQIDNLSIIDTELFGYIIARKKLKISECADIWNKSNLEIELILLNLVGLGLTTLNINKNDVSYIKHIKPRPPQFNDKSDEELKKITDILESQTQPIQLELLQQSLNFEKSILIRKLSYLVGKGYYPNAELSKNEFHKGGKLRIISSITRCETCQEKITYLEQFCSNCGTSIETCSVCKGLIATKSTRLQCPSCYNWSHESHIKSWLVIKNLCPICRTKIVIKDEQILLLEELM